MIVLKEKQDCCGCGACACACPAGCITMQADEEGFLYPQITEDACIHCDKCDKVCPIANAKEEQPFAQEGYIVQNRDEQVLRESTAGGAFTGIARYVVEHGGIVFGAALTQDLQVRHDWADRVEDLEKFRNSKYVQSDTGGTFVQAKQWLQQGRLVCFSGTPCQIEGLLCYLGKDYENLITVDVVCRAVPSPLVYRKYLQLQKARLGAPVLDIRFRDKGYGYKYSTMKLKTGENQKRYQAGLESDPWLRAFFSGLCLRPSCYHCKFKKRYRRSDFTIWDCFHVGRFSKALDNDKGATRMLIHTPKGRRLFQAISADFHFIALPPQTLTAGCAEMFHSIACPEKRSAFMKDALTLDAVQLFETYFPSTARVKAERALRMLCYKLGIYAVAKKLYVKITHKY